MAPLFDTPRDSLACESVRAGVDGGPPFTAFDVVAFVVEVEAAAVEDSQEGGKKAISWPFVTVA